MPVYEYYCSQCDAVHEVTQKIVDKPLASCPVCHSKKVRKLISRSSFQLKGTGWYVTDYRGQNKSLNGNGKSKREDRESKSEDRESKSEDRESKPVDAEPSKTPGKSSEKAKETDTKSVSPPAPASKE
jgi:putative FmdB family regulatory protein